jgi:excisionase family DNA binding protein
MSNASRYLTLKEHSEKWRVSRSKIYNQLGAGEIKGVKHGRSLLIDQQSVEALFDNLPDAKISPNPRYRASSTGRRVA